MINFRIYHSEFTHLLVHPNLCSTLEGKLRVENYENDRYDESFELSDKMMRTGDVIWIEKALKTCL